MQTIRCSGVILTTGRIRVCNSSGLIGEFDALADARRAATDNNRRQKKCLPPAYAWYTIELALPNGESRGQWAHARLVAGEMVIDPAALLPAEFCA